MQVKSHQTRTGFSLLTSEQIQLLLDTSNGYSSLHVSGLALEQKKTLVLDVDETILSASLWAAEVCVGDVVQPKHSAKKSSNFWSITGLTIAMTRTEKTVVMGDNLEIRKFFASHQEDGVYVASVWLVNQKDEQSVRLISTAELQCQFVPCFHSFQALHAYNLRRTNMAPVSFFCSGFVFRLRPHLATFLAFACEKFRVVIFTAAVKSAYRKVLKYVRRSLSPILGDLVLWEQEFFREDCDRIGKHLHKNIAKIGVDLSQVIIIDDKHRSFRGFEPNAIRIASFRGKPYDDELLRIMVFLHSIVNVRDVRYPICGIQDLEERRSYDYYSHSDSLSSSLTSIELEEFKTSSDVFPKGTSTTSRFLENLSAIYQTSTEKSESGFRI